MTSISEMRITKEHEEHDREHGYVIVDSFCTQEELPGALQNFDEVIPGWTPFAKNPTGPKPKFYLLNSEPKR